MKSCRQIRRIFKPSLIACITIVTGCANGSSETVKDSVESLSQTQTSSTWNATFPCGTSVPNIVPEGAVVSANYMEKDHYIACYSGAGINSIYMSGSSDYSKTVFVYPVKVVTSSNGTNDPQLIKDPKNAGKFISVPVIANPNNSISNQGNTFSIPVPAEASFNALIVVPSIYKPAFEAYFTTSLGVEPPYAFGFLDSLH